MKEASLFSGWLPGKLPCRNNRYTKASVYTVTCCSVCKSANSQIPSYTVLFCNLEPRTWHIPGCQSCAGREMQRWRIKHLKLAAAMRMRGWLVRACHFQHFLLIYHSDKHDRCRAERRHFGVHKGWDEAFFCTFGDPSVDHITNLFKSLLTLGQVLANSYDLWVSWEW